MDRWPKVAVVVLNYSNWYDTIECLESILRIDYPNYELIVLDNNSPNDSMDYIMAWLKGNIVIDVSPDNPVYNLFYPPVDKPIPYSFYTKSMQGNEELMLKSILKCTIPADITTKHPIALIQTGKNLGFAGGNNVGIRYALLEGDFEYIWILNNDTVVKQDSLKVLVEKAEDYKKKGKKVGIVGSKLLYYDEPYLINAVGGIYNKWFGSVALLGEFEEDVGQYDSEEVLNKIDYVHGASMLVNREFIEDVGLMCEDYFLYFEEMDWTLRGKKKGWELGYCWRCVVYHKGGGSTGTISGEDKPRIVDYYWLRNRIAFTKKFFPLCILSVYVGFVVVFWRRLRRKQFGRLIMVFKILLGKGEVSNESVEFEQDGITCL